MGPIPGKTRTGNQIGGKRISGQNGLAARGCMYYCYERKCKAILWQFFGGGQSGYECRPYDSVELKKSNRI